MGVSFADPSPPPLGGEDGVEVKGSSCGREEDGGESSAVGCFLSSSPCPSSSEEEESSICSTTSPRAGVENVAAAAAVAEGLEGAAAAAAAEGAEAGRAVRKRWSSITMDPSRISPVQRSKRHTSKGVSTNTRSNRTAFLFAFLERVLSDSLRK